MSGVRGLAEAEADEYDEIFAALKHPVRRQILLFLEERGEASFTEVQGAVSIEDTGLMSYHLKELAPLVEQSERVSTGFLRWVKLGWRFFRGLNGNGRGHALRFAVK